MSSVRAEVALVASIIALAALLRLWRLDVLPPGLHVDEAYNILDARAVIAGWRPVFLPANAGREVLFTYLQAAVLAALGESWLSARLVSAAAGILAVPALWAFARSLGLRGARIVAITAAALLATSYWHLHFSRFGIRAVLFPLVVTLTLWAWWRAVGRPDGKPRPIAWRAVAATGVLLGVAVYTHPAGRGLVLVPALHAMWRWARSHDPAPVRALAVASAIGFLLALPSIGYWATHPGSFASHAGEVSVLSQGPGRVLENAAKVAGMFNVAGDPAAWRNLTHRPVIAWIEGRFAEARSVQVPSAVRGRPVFDPLLGLLFLYGLVLLASALRDGADWAALTSIALAVLLLPSVVTDAAPNFSRSIGALPLVCLVPALALSRVAEAATGRWGRWAGAAAIVVVIGQSSYATFHDYFVRWAGAEDTPIAFDFGWVALGRFVDSMSADGWVPLLPPEAAAHPTVRVSSRAGVRSFGAQNGLVIPAAAEGRPFYISPAGTEGRDLVGDLDRAGALATVRSELVPVAGDGGGHIFMGVTTPASGFDELSSDTRWYGVQVESAREGSFLQRAMDGELDSGVASFPPLARLVAGEVPESVRPGALVTATLVWQSIGPNAGNLHAFVHLVTPDGRGVANGDGPPLAGSYQTSAWRPGDVVLDEHSLRIPLDLPPGGLELRVGWYDLVTGERLVAHATPSRLREDGTAVVAATTVLEKVAARP